MAAVSLTEAEALELVSEPATTSTPSLNGASTVGGWRELSVVSSLDGTLQPSRLWLPPGREPGAPQPLVLHLHTWSAAYHHEQFLVGKRGLVAGCEARGWAILVPNFRGRNNKPEACCSPLATADIYDALAAVATELRDAETKARNMFRRAADSAFQEINDLNAILEEEYLHRVTIDCVLQLIWLILCCDLMEEEGVIVVLLMKVLFDIGYIEEIDCWI